MADFGAGEIPLTSMIVMVLKQLDLGVTSYLGCG